MTTPTTLAPGITRIGQISIMVRDLDRAVTFYRDVLGLRFLFAAPRLAFFDCGGVRIMLGVPEKPEFDHPASILYYRVDDIGAAAALLAARGAHLEHQPERVAEMPDHELWLAFFRDTEGNPVALMSEVPRT